MMRIIASIIIFFTAKYCRLPTSTGADNGGSHSDIALGNMPPSVEPVEVSNLPLSAPAAPPPPGVQPICSQPEVCPFSTQNAS